MIGSLSWGQVRRTEQSYQFVRGPFDEVVDDRPVELLLRRELLVGVDQPAANRLRVVGPPADEPALELLDAGRSEEDQLRLGHRGPDLPGALQVDLEQHRIALREPALDLGPRRAVEIARELGPLEELATVDQPLELRTRDEVVMLAVGLVVALLTG